MRLHRLLPLLLLFASPVGVSAQTFCDFAPRMTVTGSGAAVGVPVSIGVAVTDPNGDAILSLTADTSGLPAGNDASFTTNADNTAGTLTWTPQVGETGTYSVSFTAGNALSTSATTAIRVIDTAGQPFVACPGIQSTGEFRPLSFLVTAGDPEGEPIVSFTAAPLPAGATFTVNATNTAGTFAWTPDFTQAGSYSIDFTATSSTSSTCTTTINVGQGDRAPVVIAPLTASGSVGVPLTICVQAIEPDGDAIVNWFVSPIPQGATFTTSPSREAGTLSWTPAPGQAGTYNITFCASNSLTGCATVQVTIEGSGDTPPLLTVPSAVTFLVNFPAYFIVTANDPNGDPITSLTASNLPAGASFTTNAGNTQGTLSWTPAVGQGGTYFVLFTATANGVSSTATTAINVTGDELQASTFTTGGNGTIRLSSGKPVWCAHLEPAGGSFEIGDVIPSSIVLLSAGTGSVSQIPVLQGKSPAVGDANRNEIADLEVCFSKEDLKLLFSNVASRQSFLVTIRGDLAGGSRFSGTVVVDVAPGGGSNVASLTPNPPSPVGTLRFETSRGGAVKVRVFDIRGRLVRTIGSGGFRSPGDHAIRFDGLADDGTRLPSGVYLIRIETPDGERTAKASILR